MCRLQDVGSDSGSKPPDQLFQHFLQWSDEMCKAKPFTKFWVQEFLSKHCMHFDIMQEEIRYADAYTMEVVFRQTVPLF